MQANGNPKPHGKPQNIIPMPPSVDVVPYSQEAEEAVIGACLISSEMFSKVALFLKPEHFYFLRHTYIWQALLDLQASNEPTDDQTLIANRLRESNHLDLVGGSPYLTQLVAITGNTQYAVVYGRLVERIHDRRKLMMAADNMRQMALDETITLEELKAASYDNLDIVFQQSSIEQPEHIGDALSDHMDHVEKQYAIRDQRKSGAPLALNDLNVMLDGIHKRRMYVVVARRHNGKTAFLLTNALASAKMGTRVLIINCADGDKRDVINNLCAIETGIEAYRIDTGQMSEQEYQLYVEAAGRIARLPIFVESVKSITTRQIYTSAKAIQHEHGLDLIVLDYFQYVEPSDSMPPTNQDYKKKEWVAKKLAEMISENYLNVGMLMAAQANRASRSNPGGRPTIDNVEGYGLEKEMDVGIVVHRPGAYNKDAPDPNLTEVIVQKNKVTNKTGLVKSTTDRKTGRFNDYIKP